MVLICHAPFSSQGSANATWSVYPPEAVTSVMEMGHYGVQLFLVVSGFCIHLRWAKLAGTSQGIKFLPFWKRRFLRLYPAYIVTLVATIVFAYVGNILVYNDGHSLWLDLLSLLTQTQNLTGASWRIGNGPLWSLALEEQLYLLYFLLLLMRRRWGWRTTLITISGINLLWVAGASYVPEAIQRSWLLAAPAYWLPWALGAVSAEAWTGKSRLPRWTASLTLAGLLGLLALALPGGFEALAVSIGFFFVLRFAVELETRWSEVPPWLSSMLALGTISYSVYLVHNPVFVVAKRLLLSTGLPLPIVLLLRIAAGVIAGYVLYRWVESRQWFKSRTTSGSLQHPHM